MPPLFYVYYGPTNESAPCTFFSSFCKQTRAHALAAYGVWAKSSGVKNGESFHEIASGVIISRNVNGIIGERTNISQNDYLSESISAMQILCKILYNPRRKHVYNNRDSLLTNNTRNKYMIIIILIKECYVIICALSINIYRGFPEKNLSTHWLISTLKHLRGNICKVMFMQISLSFLLVFRVTSFLQSFVATRFTQHPIRIRNDDEEETRASS